MTTEEKSAIIHPKDRNYVCVAGDGKYRFAAQYISVPIDGENGIVLRFYNGASVAQLARDFAVRPRMIEAAIRTMMRYEDAMVVRGR
jgi:hypothetical protein